MAITKIQSESLNLSDNYDFTGTVTGAGGTNTPNLALYKNTDQNIGDAANTKITFDTENFDTDNAWSSNTFTVPSGKAGKYLIQFGFQSFNSDSTIRSATAKIYKNGSLYQSQSGEYTDNGQAFKHMFTQAVRLLNLSVGDTIEFYGNVNITSGTAICSGDSYASITKIIE